MPPSLILLLLTSLFCRSSGDAQPPACRPQSNTEHPESIYALDCNATGTCVVTGATDKTVRLWDPRANRRTGTPRSQQSFFHLSRPDRADICLCAARPQGY